MNTRTIKTIAATIAAAGALSLAGVATGDSAHAAVVSYDTGAAADTVGACANGRMAVNVANAGFDYVIFYVYDGWTGQGAWAISGLRSAMVTAPPPATSPPAAPRPCTPTTPTGPAPSGSPLASGSCSATATTAWADHHVHHDPHANEAGPMGPPRSRSRGRRRDRVSGSSR